MARRTARPPQARPVEKEAVETGRRSETRRSLPRRTRSGDPLDLREEFDPTLIRALYSNFRSGLEALQELVDNCVDDRVEGRPLRIDIRLRPRSIQVTNVGGSGMNLEGIRLFLQWGYSAKQGKLGRYGQGGKAAMGYLGRSWRLRAMKEGEQVGYTVEEPDWHDRSRGLKCYRARVSEQLFPAMEGHVEITIGKLQRKLQAARVVRRLSEVYRPLLQEGSVVILVNGVKLSPLEIPVVRRDPLGGEINVGGRQHEIEGWVGLQEPGTGLAGGVRCYAFGRLIASGEFFGHPDTAYRASLNRLVGEVHLDFVPLIMNKTDFDRDSPEWQAAFVLLHQQLKPHVEELLRDAREEKVSDRERRLAREVQELWARLLRLLSEADRLPPSGEDVPGAEEAAGLMGQGGSDQVGGGGVAGERQGPEDDPGEGPAEEPPGDGPEQDETVERPPSQAGRGRKKRALPIEIRPLDERVRFTVTGEEEKVLVINNRYPLYRLRGGDRLYLLETAALEIAVGEEAEEAREYLVELNRLVYEMARLVEGQGGPARR